MFVDTHAHLHYEELRNQLDNVIRRAADVGVEIIICVGTDLDSSKTSIAIAEEYVGVFATVGVHPHDAERAPIDYLKEIERLSEHPKVVALGEMGLDFYRNLSARQAQIDVFTAQLNLAHSIGLPVVVHNRDADDVIYEVITSVGYTKGVIHCFSGDVTAARKILDFGFRISFTGTITFGKSGKKAALKEIPLELIMLETDCPFLAPVPNRGKCNEPANIPYIAEKIAGITNQTVDSVASITTGNAIQFFNLPV